MKGNTHSARSHPFLPRWFKRCDRKLRLLFNPKLRLESQMSYKDNPFCLNKDEIGNLDETSTCTLIVKGQPCVRDIISLMLWESETPRWTRSRARAAADVTVRTLIGVVAPFHSVVTRNICQAGINIVCTVVTLYTVLGSWFLSLLASCCKGHTTSSIWNWKDRLIVTAFKDMVSFMQCWWIHVSTVEERVAKVGEVGLIVVLIWTTKKLDS
jgi:hypothetical protein